MHVGEQFESSALKRDLVDLCLNVFESPKAFQDAIFEMELTRSNAEEKLADEKSKRAGQRAALAKRPRVRYDRDDDDDDDRYERANHSDDEEMDVVEEEAQREVMTRRGRKSKRGVREDDATLHEQQQSINEDIESRKRHKQNQEIRKRQTSILQSSNGEKSLCTECAETYPNIKFCECFTP